MAPSRFKDRIALVLTLFLFLLLAQSYTASGAAPGDSDRAGVAKKLHSLQLPFIENKGQLQDGSVRYYARTFGGTVFITEDGEIVYALPKYDATGQAVGARRAVPLQEAIQEKSGWTLKESFAGASIVNVSGEDPAATSISYFKGNDPAKWKTGLTTYNQVNLGEIYSGIELKLKAYGNNVEKLFHVKPGADPGMIKIRLDVGARSRQGGMPLPLEGKGGLSVNDNGELEIETGLGLVKFTKPVAYQEEGGKKKYIEVAYAIEGDGYTFKVGEYDGSKELVIDPLLVASTFIGGSSNEESYSIALNAASGNVYVAGYTYSSDFPTSTGAYDTTYNGGNFDAFVARLNGDLTSLLASTFIGGSSDDSVNSIAIALDASGNVYVTGITFSSDFPTTTLAYDTTYNGGNFDGFVARLNGDLTSLLASTFIGGIWGDTGQSIALDANGNVYVTGKTEAYFPTTAGAYDTTYNSSADAFVSKLDSDLQNLLASTYLGGTNTDYGYSIALDANGDVYVTGETYSSDFPTTALAYDTTYNGNYDVFVAKLNGALTSLLASTFIGGGDYDRGYSIALDASGNVYVTGNTVSSDFPTTGGAYDRIYNGGTFDVFVAKLDSALQNLVASTFIGGSSDDSGYSIAVDGSGKVYVSGWTYSPDFPTTTGAYDTTFNGNYDVFVAKLNGALTSLHAATFIGGGSIERGYSIALDASGNVYVTGWTWSSDFPTTPGAYDTTFNGGVFDVFVAKLDSALCGAFVVGDLDGDGDIDIHDITAAIQMAIGVPNALLSLCATDVNGDGLVNILDAIILVGLVTGPH